MDAHGYALGQTNPLEGRTDIRQEVVASAAIFLGNTPAQAVDPPFERLIGIGHEGDDGPVPLAYICNRVFSEKPVNPEAVEIHQRQCRLVRHGLATQPEIKVGHIAIHRGFHQGKLEVEFRLLQRRLELKHTGLGVALFVFLVFEFLLRHGARIPYSYPFCPLRLFLGIELSHLGRTKLRPALVDRGLEGAGVDLEQQVAGLHHLVVLYGKLDDRSGNPGRNLDDLGTNLSVPSPGVDNIIPVFVNHQGCGDNDKESCQEILLVIFHFLHPNNERSDKDGIYDNQGQKDQWWIKKVPR